MNQCENESVYESAVAADLAVRPRFDLNVAHFDHDPGELECPGAGREGIEDGFPARGHVVDERLVGVQQPPVCDQIGVVHVVEAVGCGGIQAECCRTAALRWAGGSKKCRHCLAHLRVLHGV